MSRGLAASLVVAAALTLPVAGGTLAAVAASGAVVAVWMVGSAGGGRRRGLDRATSGGLVLALVGGTLMAAGLADGPGFFGLPRSLWGLLLGIWLIPLVLTSAGFAVSFRPPDAADLDRLRAASRPDA